MYNNSLAKKQLVRLGALYIDGMVREQNKLPSVDRLVIWDIHAKASQHCRSSSAVCLLTYFANDL